MYLNIQTNMFMEKKKILRTSKTKQIELIISPHKK